MLIENEIKLVILMSSELSRLTLLRYNYVKYFKRSLFIHRTLEIRVCK